jgi:hypothetical protein
MARKKGQISKAISFRTSQEIFELLTEIGAMKNIDITSALNQILTEAAPGLVAWRTRQRAALVLAEIADSVSLLEKALKRWEEPEEGCETDMEKLSVMVQCVQGHYSKLRLREMELFKQRKHPP